MRKRFMLFCCTGLLISATQAQDRGLISVNTRLVEVTVVVRDKNGPVTNLTKDDFTVLDNGKPQRIAVFNVKSIQRASIKPVPLPPGVVSNRLNPSGEEPEAATVVLWDSLNTEGKDQSFVRGEVLKYLGTMKPGDPVALYSMAKMLKVIQNFTQDPERLIKAVTGSKPEQSTNLQAADLGDLARQINSPVMAALSGGQGLADNQMAAQKGADELDKYELRDRAELTEACLEAIAQHLTGMPGRKRLIWITAGFPMLKKFPGEDLDFGPLIDKAVRKLNNANVAVYPIDPRGVVTGTSMQNQHFVSGDLRLPENAAGLGLVGIDLMNVVAAGTGGRSSYGRNDVAAALHNAMEDDDITYTLGFYASTEKLDGAFHSLSVKVARNNMDVRSRKSYLSLDTALTTTGLWREALNESMQNPLEETSLGLRASATPAEKQPGVYTLELILDLADVHFEREKNRWVATVSYATHFAPSETTRGSLETIRISLTEDKLRAALKDGYTLRRSIAAGDLKGELRVVVEDRTTGALGSVTIPIGQK